MTMLPLTPGTKSAHAQAEESSLRQVTILIPVFNEERFVEALLQSVVRVAGASEIVVIDDGSTDQTPEVLARLSRELPIRLIAHPRNMGKGAALRTGLAAAHRDIILIQDADLELNPEDYPQLLKPILQRKASIVYGSRFLGSHRTISFWSRFGNWVIATLVNLLFHATLTDVETGYKVFRKEVLKDIHLRSCGFDFDVEFTCKVLQAGHTIFEVPVVYYGRTYAEGKKVTWKDGVEAIRVILGCRLNRRP